MFWLRRHWDFRRKVKGLDIYMPPLAGPGDRNSSGLQCEVACWPTMTQVAQSKSRQPIDLMNGLCMYVLFVCMYVCLSVCLSVCEACAYVCMTGSSTTATSVSRLICSALASTTSSLVTYLVPTTILFTYLLLLVISSCCCCCDSPAGYVLSSVVHCPRWGSLWPRPGLSIDLELWVLSDGFDCCADVLRICYAVVIMGSSFCATQANSVHRLLHDLTTCQEFNFTLIYNIDNRGTCIDQFNDVFGICAKYFAKGD